MMRNSGCFAVYKGPKFSSENMEDFHTIQQKYQAHLVLMHILSAKYHKVKDEAVALHIQLDEQDQLRRYPRYNGPRSPKRESAM
jgi:hypothetical protein